MSDTEQLHAMRVSESPGGAADEPARFNAAPRIPQARQRYLQRKYKVERLLGYALLLPAAPVILVVCFLVKITSRGPALYRQVRLGHNRSTYEILKIRTMRLDAEADGVARWCTKNDSRITPLGRFLRKVHLDELPQLINVARGDMVLVGPRPERPQIGERLAEEIEGYYDRLCVKPGITGLAQINLPPDETLEDARRKQLLDLQYIQEANAWLDFRMLAATGLRMCGIRGDRVTKMMRLWRRSLLGDLAPSAERNAPQAAVAEMEQGTLEELSLDIGDSCLALQGVSHFQSHEAVDRPRRPR